MAVIGQHRRGGAVPGDDIPDRRPDESRAVVQRVEHALQTRRHPFSRLVMDFGRAAEAEQEKMFALDVRQHQGAGNAVEYIRRGRAAPPLFQPGVPGGLIFARCATSSRRRPGVRRRVKGQAERGGIELGTAILQIVPEQVLV